MHVPRVTTSTELSAAVVDRWDGNPAP